jgi:hypothetical protein
MDVSSGYENRGGAVQRGYAERIGVADAWSGEGGEQFVQGNLVTLWTWSLAQYPGVKE